MTCTHVEFGRDAGFVRLSGFLSRLAESQSRSVIGVFPGPASAPCLVVDFSCSEGVLFLELVDLLGLEKEELFFCIGGREESHGNLVVAPLSNFQQLAHAKPGLLPANAKPGLPPAHAKSGLPPAKAKPDCPGTSQAWLPRHKLSPVAPENAKSHASHAEPCTNLWFAFVPMLTL